MVEIWKVAVVVALVTLCPAAMNYSKRGRFAAAGAATLLFTAVLLFPVWWPAF